MTDKTPESLAESEPNRFFDSSLESSQDSAYSHAPALGRNTVNIVYFANRTSGGIHVKLSRVGDCPRWSYLSPYSPDFSPIENCWSKIKESLRAQAARTYDALNDTIAVAIDGITEQDIIGWFTHCCYCSQGN